MSIVYIYGLIDPRNELIIENVRYVGKTKNVVWRRLSKHIQDSKKGIAPIHKWIRKLKKDNIKPQYIIIKECNQDNWKESEKEYILKLRKINRLLNVTDGGEAESSYRPPTTNVFCYNRNGDFVREYSSMTEASSDVGVSISKISLALNQRINKSSAGCYWFTTLQKKENIYFRKAAKRNIPIVQKTLTGELIAEFKSQSEAEKLTGINSKLINKSLRIPTYSQTNGYKWEYKII